MGRKCLTCTHPKYRAINRSLVEGRQPVSEISRQYGISTDALHAHKKRCLHTNLRLAQQRRELDYADELWGVFKKSLTRLATNVDDLEDVIAQTKKRKHYNSLLKALSEVRATLELSYKLMHSINATQTAEQDISLALHDERLPQVLQELSTDELRVFHTVISKIVNRTSTPLLEVGSGPVIDVNGGGASEVAGDDLEDEDDYESLMIRTRFPRDLAEGERQDSVGEPSAPDQVNAQDDGGEDQDELEPVETTPPERKWRPPLSQIHFADAQSFIGHLYRKRKR